jgi:hypothetical protein
MNKTAYKFIATGLLSAGAIAVSSAAIAFDGPSTANGGALTTCAVSGLLVTCKPSDQVATVSIAAPDTSRYHSPGAYGDNGNFGNDGGPGSGAPGGSGMSDQ